MKKHPQNKFIRVSVLCPDGMRRVKRCPNAHVARFYVTAFKGGWFDGSSSYVVREWQTPKVRRWPVISFVAQMLGHMSIRRKPRA